MVNSSILVPTALKWERKSRMKFRSYLDKKDRKMFDKMYDYVKLNNAAEQLTTPSVD